MDSEEICDICDKSIPSMSIQMHKVHCERNTIKCNSCGQKMHKQDLEKHTSETHTLKRCETCSVELEIRFFSTHDCPKKPVQCEFCEAFLPRDQLRAHHLDCGNRTEQCPRCQEFIKRREFKDHIRARKCKDYAEKLREQEHEREVRRKREQEEKKIEELQKRRQEEKKIEELQKRRQEERKNEEIQKKKREEEERNALEIRRQIEEKKKVKREEIKNDEKKQKIPSIGAEREPAGRKDDSKGGISKAKVTTFNAAQRKSGAKSGSDVRVNQPAGRGADLKPKANPKFQSKPVPVRENAIGPEDYENFYEVPEIDPIPDFPEDVFEKQVLRRKSPNPMSESQNFTDEQILQQIIAESKREYIGIDGNHEEMILNQVLLNSMKEK